MGYFLANSRNFQLNKSKKSAFSLIELSIVLIIIGLLVAGVRGGVSLIQSAKTRALMGEIRNYNSGSIRSLCNERIGYDRDYPDFDDYTATIDYNNGMKSKNAGCDEMTFKLEI